MPRLLRLIVIAVIVPLLLPALPVKGQEMTQELVLYYDGQVNEEGRLIDQSGNEHHAVINGVKLRESGLSHRVMTFDGENAHLKVPGELNVEGAFSVSVWVRFEGLGNPYQRILGNRVLWRSPEGFEFEVSPYTSSMNISGANLDGETQGMFPLDFIEQMKVPRATRALDQEIHPGWVHLVATLNKQGVNKIYVDGKLIHQRKGVATAVKTKVPLMIGAAPVKTEEGAMGVRDFFHGEMADLRLYNGALGIEQIQKLSSMVLDQTSFDREQKALDSRYQEQLKEIGHSTKKATEAELKGAELIKQGYQAMLMSDPTWDAEKANRFLAEQSEEGAWPDLDYKSQQVTRWPAGDHVGRLVQLSKVYRDTDHALHKNPELLQAIQRGIKFYVDSKLYSENWWWNEIGVPRLGAMLLCLMGDHLKQEDLERVDVMISDPLRMGERKWFTGQNLIWRARVVLLQAAWKKDIPRLRRAMKEISEEVIVTESEGLQVDGSFWQHDEQLYTHGYGASFALEVAELIKLTDGTPFALPAEKAALMDLLILDGQQWMLRSGFRDPMAMGRNIARPGATGVIFGQRNYPYIAGLMAGVKGPRRAEYQAYQQRLLGKGEQLVGQRVFWRSDFTTHHRPGFYIGVKSTSDRMLQNEAGNWENLMGRFLGDGITTIVTHGKEYADIYPVWDWRYLPGATSVGNPMIKGRGMNKKGSHPFAGGVTDGQVGIHVMVKDTEKLKAKKAWFLLEEGMVALGTGIENRSRQVASTTVNQVFLKGEVKALLGDGVHTLKSGEYETMAKAIEHDGILYWLPGKNDYRLSSIEQSGRWRTINHAYSDEEISAEVFKLHMNHPAQLEAQSYHYAVFPGMKMEELQKPEIKVPYTLLKNTPKIQAISQEDKGILYVVFHESGSLTWQGTELRVSKACIVIVKRGERDLIFVKDPTQKEFGLRLEWNLRSSRIIFPMGPRRGASGKGLDFGN